MNTVKSAIASAFLLAISSASYADSLSVSFNLAGAAGNEATVSGASNSAYVSSMILSRGTGLSSGAAANSFSSSGWTGESTDYYSISFTIADGYTADLSQFLIGTRSSNTGPGSLILTSSIDSFASTITTFSQSGTAFLNSDVSLNLTSVVGTIEFRVYQVGTTSANGGTTSSSGTFRFTNYFLDSVDSGGLTFNGMISAITPSVPEPSTYAIFAGAVALGCCVSKRRRKTAVEA